VASWSDAPDCTVRMMGPIGGRCPAAPVVMLLLAFVIAACAPEAPATEPVARGRQLYHSLGCANCHEPNLFGQRLGPPLDHLGAVAATRRPGLSAEAYLRQSILDPGAYVVPGYQDSMPRDLGRDLSPTDLDALVAYLLSLK
jgi:mono/diheme cytochrome c family protein